MRIDPREFDMDVLHNAWRKMEHIGEDVFYQVWMDHPNATIIIYRTQASEADMQWQEMAVEEGVGLELRVSIWTASEAFQRQDEASQQARSLAEGEDFQLYWTSQGPEGITLGVKGDLDKATTLLGNISYVIAVELTDLTPAGGGPSI